MAGSAVPANRCAPVYGMAVWGWGLWTGLALWLAGFVLLPWWAALLLWWWPSLMMGALTGLFAVWVAGRLAPRPRAERS